ncbi:hypothetical protein HPB48_014765 [Haemaphysalis longicornis]|uniref:Caspase family p20 domain-containing protein n=1 Tax=Haemaphysalis longicornis TaxID=44386 RepID=A0A9J6FC14_HAELO|nr:hypothetical protein HPB48_014765 [Haemaphysalis longicornis]
MALQSQFFQVYRMSKMPRGQCIIINNKDFEDESKRRPGSEIDVDRMQQLFRALHFDVCIGSNLTAAVCWREPPYIGSLIPLIRGV